MPITMMYRAHLVMKEASSIHQVFGPIRTQSNLIEILCFAGKQKLSSRIPLAFTFNSLILFDPLVRIDLAQTISNGSYLVRATFYKPLHMNWKYKYRNKINGNIFSSNIWFRVHGSTVVPFHIFRSMGSISISIGSIFVKEFFEWDGSILDTVFIWWC